MGPKSPAKRDNSWAGARPCRVPDHGYKADLYWPQQGLVVEFDGWQAHGHRLAFESNRKRDQILIANGLRVLRVTDRQLTNEPIAVVARIAQALR